jgi:ammonium transporter Rh
MPTLVDKKDVAKTEDVELGAMDSKAEPTTTTEGAQVFLLIEAARKGDSLKVAQLIKNQKVDPSAVDYDNRSALHLAVCEGKENVVDVLIELGTDVNLKDRQGNTALDDAVTYNRENIANKLRAQGAKHADVSALHSLLIKYVAAHDNEKAANLIENNVDVNCSDYDERTPLHLAVATRNSEMVKLLLDKGADYHAKDRFGSTPWQDADRHVSRSGTDPIKEAFLAHDHSLGHHAEGGWDSFVVVFLFIEVIMIALIAALAEYDVSNDKGSNTAGFVKTEGFKHVNDVYGWFMDVHVMIFIGFGFLMTFLRKASFSAVGFTFLIGAYCIQLHILIEGLVEYLIHGEAHIVLNIEKLIVHDFCAGTVLVTYGVVLGKVSPMQLLLIASLESFFYTITEIIALDMGITDIGGSMVIHMFGAFFGVSLATVMQSQWINKDLSNNASVYHSDMFAMIGTVFLWMFWPSFNGVLGADDESRHYAVVNTVLSLCGSCMAAFLFSNYFRGEREFCMVDIQNATLAGGVAMGTSADLHGNPGTSILIGFIAGLVSVIGYVHIQPWLEHKIGLHDTCGVHNLHGMPSIIGALAGLITISLSDNAENFPLKNQVIYMFVVFFGSILTGALTGLIVKAASPLPEKYLFQDAHAWEVPAEETPFFFDARGEIQRDDSKGSNPQSREIQLLKKRLQDLEARTVARGPAAASGEPASSESSVVEKPAGLDLASLEALFTRVLDARDSKKNE